MIDVAQVLLVVFIVLISLQVSCACGMMHSHMTQSDCKFSQSRAQ